MRPILHRLLTLLLGLGVAAGLTGLAGDASGKCFETWTLRLEAVEPDTAADTASPETGLADTGEAPASEPVPWPASMDVSGGMGAGWYSIGGPGLNLVVQRISDLPPSTEGAP